MVRNTERLQQQNHQEHHHQIRAQHLISWSKLKWSRVISAPEEEEAEEGGGGGGGNGGGGGGEGEGATTTTGLREWPGPTLLAEEERREAKRERGAREGKQEEEEKMILSGMNRGKEKRGREWSEEGSRGMHSRERGRPTIRRMEGGRMRRRYQQ